MTREEAIDILYGIKDGTTCLMKDMPRRGEIAIDMAIDVLKQPELCEDAVSREDMLIELDAWREVFDENGHKESCTDIKLVRKSMALLPSAQLKRPIGHWIPVDSHSAFGGDEATWMAHGNPIAYYYCSNCKQQARADEEGKDILSNFCPDCGADMRGEQNESN